MVTRSPGYALLVERDGLDLRRFDRELEDADRSLGATPSARWSTRGAALSFWRGPPLADFAYASFAQRAIARLQELRVAALELRIDAELARGRHGRIVGDLQGPIEANPLRERLWRQLMLCAGAPPAHARRSGARAPRRGGA